METPRKLIIAAEMDKMTLQERADDVEAGRAKSWDDVPEPFKSEVLATAGRTRRTAPTSACLNSGSDSPNSSLIASTYFCPTNAAPTELRR